MRYADEIFALGTELQDAIEGGREAAPSPLLRIGIADSVPKAVAYRVVEPALRLQPAPRLLCAEGKLPDLLADLSMRRLELVISDKPLPGHLGVQAYAHLLGRSGTAFFASEALLERHGLRARGLRQRFPRGLDALPLLLPGLECALRPRLDAWLRRHGLAGRVAGEFQDTALMKAFGRQGAGVFPAPAVLAGELARQYEVVHLGTVEEVVEEFYGISVERRITHPAVHAITAAAREQLFGG